MRRPGHDGNLPVRRFLNGAAVLVLAVFGWFVASTAGELIGAEAADTALGKWLAPLLLVAGIIVVPVAVGCWVFIRWINPPPELPDADPPPVPGPPVPPEPPVWRRPGPIFGRDREVAAVVRTALETGVAVVVGPRDVGTSAVAEAAVQRLTEFGDADHRPVVPLDLRSRSSQTPDDARAAAGRILSTFGLDEPANGTRKVLANAAERFHDHVSKRYSVLLLDNVAEPDEITWLVAKWTELNVRRPWLVIAGESAIDSVAPDNRVTVGPLSMAGMREIWYADTGTTRREPARPRVSRRRFPRWLWELFGPPAPEPPRPPAADPIDRLLRACGGRPRAIKAIVRETAGGETTGAGREAEVRDLLESLNSDENNPLVRIWRAILDRAEGSLDEDAAWLLHALALLPVTALTREAVTALMAARRDGTDEPKADATLPAEVGELRKRGFLQEVGERYRLPLEIRWALTGRTTDPDADADAEVARVAVPALVRHHADRVERMAYRLDVRTVGAKAAQWLHDEERSLRPLFSVESYKDDEVLLAAIDDLARIASALEYWYVREQQADGLLKVSTALGTLAARAERPGLCALAAAREATAHRMAENLAAARRALALVAPEAHTSTVHDLGAELAVRLQVENALLELDGGEPGSDGAGRAAVRARLEDIARHHQHPGAGIALINLGALCLAGKATDDALRHLRKAEALARERSDVGCQAQAVELQGIALSTKDLHEAVSLWQGARRLFADIGEEQGEARCLQHLGAAALVEPTAAGLIEHGTRTALDSRAAAAVARPLLERSKKLRAGQPDTELVDTYLAQALARLESPEQDPGQA